MHATDDPHPSLIGRLTRLAIFVTFIVLIAFGAQRLLSWALKTLHAPGGAELMAVFVLSSILLVYAALIALPFVPGIEIGVTIMVLGGTSLAPLVYGATLLGLLTAFAVGLAVPGRILAQFFRDIGLRQAAGAVERMRGMDVAAREAMFHDMLPKRLGDGIMRWRYLGLALLLNIPGNAVVGGGGGILMLSGLSRVFRAPLVCLTVALAVLPPPLAVWIWGPGLLPTPKP